MIQNKFSVKFSVMKLDLTGIDYTDVSGLCLMNVGGV